MKEERSLKGLQKEISFIEEGIKNTKQQLADLKKDYEKDSRKLALEASLKDLEKSLADYQSKAKEKKGK